MAKLNTLPALTLGLRTDYQIGTTSKQAESGGTPMSSPLVSALAFFGHRLRIGFGRHSPRSILTHCQKRFALLDSASFRLVSTLGSLCTAESSSTTRHTLLKGGSPWTQGSNTTKGEQGIPDSLPDLESRSRRIASNPHFLHLDRFKRHHVHPSHPQGSVPDSDDQSWPFHHPSRSPTSRL